MSTGLFLALCGLAVSIGLLVGHRWLVAVAPFLWILGILIAAAAGAFAPTGEDNSFGVFVFTGLPTVVWALLLILGVGVRCALRRDHRQ